MPNSHKRHRQICFCVFITGSLIGIYGKYIFVACIIGDGEVTSKSINLLKNELGNYHSRQTLFMMLFLLSLCILPMWCYF